MKKLFLAALMTVCFVMFAGNVLAGNDCATIKDGTLLYSTGHYLGGQPLETGYDPFGYNYQARKFRGSYANAYLGRSDYGGNPPYEDDDATYLAENPDAASLSFWPYRKVTLMMKWNDPWLSNKGCDDDGVLDRYYGFDSYIGSGAWLTNHQFGSYVNWNLTGGYDLEFTCTSGCSGDYPHIMNINAWDNGTGDFSGSGYYIPGPLKTWDVSGVVNSSSVSFRILYTGTDAGYFVDLEGTIDSNGIMSGTATSSSGQTFDWETTTGVVTGTGEICDWDYFVKIVAAPDGAYPLDGVWYTANNNEIGPVIWGSFAIIQEVENDACAEIFGKQYGSPIGPGFGKFKPELNN